MDNNQTQPNQTPAQSSMDPKTMAMIAYILFFVPLITDQKNDPFVKFHVKQSIMLLISWVIASTVSAIIPILGWFLIGPAITIAFIVLFIMGILNASKGETKPLPLIGKYAEQLFKF